MRGKRSVDEIEHRVCMPIGGVVRATGSKGARPLAVFGGHHSNILAIGTAARAADETAAHGVDASGPARRARARTRDASVELEAVSHRSEQRHAGSSQLFARGPCAHFESIEQVDDDAPRLGLLRAGWKQVTRPAEYAASGAQRLEVRRDVRPRSNDPRLFERREFTAAVVEQDGDRVHGLERPADPSRAFSAAANDGAHFPDLFREQSGDHVGFAHLDRADDERVAVYSAHTTIMPLDAPACDSSLGMS